MMKIIFRNFGLTQFETEELIVEHKSTIFELIMMKVFNYYAKVNTEKEVKEFEATMSKASKEGDAESQKASLKIFEETIIKYPELTEEIKQMLSKLHTEMFFDYMEKANSEDQVELLTYMLRKKRDIKETGKVFDEYNRKQELLEN